MKLKKKTRIGGKVRRLWEKAKTPYQRVLERPDIPKETKDRLTVIYQTLNPAKLLREIQKITNLLLRS